MNEQLERIQKPLQQGSGELFLRALFLATLVFVMLCIAGFSIAGGFLLITGYQSGYEKVFLILEQAAGWALLAVSIPILVVTGAVAIDLLKTAFVSVKTAFYASESENES